MMNRTLNDDFRDFLDALNEAAVEYVVVGAYALAAHGIVRATGDIDIFVRPSEQNANRVINALMKFGAPLSLHGVEQSDFETPEVVYQLGLPPRRIDLLTTISGVSFDEAWASKDEIEVDGRSFYVLGREALLANKRASGRPKDLADVEALERSEESE